MVFVREVVDSKAGVVLPLTFRLLNDTSIFLLTFSELLPSSTT